MKANAKDLRAKGAHVRVGALQPREEAGYASVPDSAMLSMIGPEIVDIII